MSKHDPIPPRKDDMAQEPSLLERAAELYDFGAALRSGAGPIKSAETVESGGDDKAVELLPAQPEVEAGQAPEATDAPEAQPVSTAHLSVPVQTPVAPGPDDRVAEPLPTNMPATRFPDDIHPVDRAFLAEAGYILPDGPVTVISEEFRIVKRQLLRTALGQGGATPAHAGRILISSAHSGEGKTFTAVNLALSMAAEKDIEVLLVDADFAKPSITGLLGLPEGPGLMDALVDPSIAVQDYVMRTDIPGLSVLPAGHRTNNDSEYLASSRTRHVLEALTTDCPGRILLFDSPPVLAASPASVLATHVGQVVLVVRADKTTESTLRDAVGLLQGNGVIQLLLNGVRFSATGRRFGTYYGQED